MEEKKTIKISLGTAICLVIIFVLVVALFGMWAYYNSNNNTTTSNIANTSTENKKINKVYNDKELVYSSYTHSSSDNYREYSYSIPYINIKSSDIKNLNNEIETRYKKFENGPLKSSREDSDTYILGISYTSYINNNILSLVIEQHGDADCNSYETYNVDIYTGKRLSNLEIISKKNITESDFLNKVVDICEKAFISAYGTREEHIKREAELYDVQYENTISKSNYSINAPIFLDENGTLNAVVSEYTLAGRGEYYNIVDIGI